MNFAIKVNFPPRPGTIIGGAGGCPRMSLDPVFASFWFSVVVSVFGFVLEFYVSCSNFFRQVIACRFIAMPVLEAILAVPTTAIVAVRSCMSWKNNSPHHREFAPPP